MNRKPHLRFAAVLLVMSLVAAACGGDDPAPQSDPGASSGEAKKGGTLRVGTDAFEWNANLDPTGEYLGTAWAMYTQLMLRPLVNYRHIAGEAGNEIVADLATEVPEATDGGTTWTFTLKDGVKFAPPVDREITSQDVKFAFERIATPGIVAQYGFYFTPVIEGMQEFADGKADDISGIETPDDKTIVFRTTEPVGDFLYRLAMPAAAPIPEEVAKCFTKAGEYGRYVVSSGPYMFQGSADLDITSCKTMKPVSGFDPNEFVKLERNPNYDESTDDPEQRENHFDKWELTLNTNTQDIFDKIAAGELDMEVASPPAQTLREYSTNEDLKDRLQSFSGDRTWYLSMNLTQPPFDDIHVRKAMNYVMDKQGLQTAWGGPIRGEIATHILPDVMIPGLLEDFDAYPSEGYAGDLEAAKEEMRQSKYDSDGDGLCDDPVCEGILHITRSTPPWTEMVPVIEDSMSKIGIQVETRELEDSYTAIQTVSRNVPFNSNAGWGKDYPDASTFMVLFDSGSFLPEGNINYSLVGLTPDLNEELELGAEGNLEGIPSVDADVDACNAVIDIDERLQCWADLDQKLMEEVVPWVPYLDATNIDVISDAVGNYQYDQNSGEAGWSHIWVDQDLQE